MKEAGSTNVSLLLVRSPDTDTQERRSFTTHLSRDRFPGMPVATWQTNR